MNKEYNCPNVGCRKVFKWREQLKQHKLKCSFEASEKVKKYEKENGAFKCLTCFKAFSKQLEFLQQYNIINIIILCQLEPAS